MTTSNNLVNEFVDVFNDLLAYVDINHKFMCEVPESTLNSTEFVNILIGVTGDVEGNVMFGYTLKTAKEIASKLMGADEVPELDIYAKSALADFFFEFSKRVFSLVKKSLEQEVANQEKKDYTLLPSHPTYIQGENMYAMISKVPSKKLFFKINGEKFDIAYSLENK